MIAGSLRIDCTSSREVFADDNIGIDTMQPQLGWLMYEKKSTSSSYFTGNLYCADSKYSVTT
jgi:hypothetical protein